MIHPKMSKKLKNSIFGIFLFIPLENTLWFAAGLVQILRTRVLILRVGFLTGFIFLAACFSVFAQAKKQDKPVITARADIDKKEIFIGDKIKYELSVNSVKNLEIEFPQFAQNLGDFAVKDFDFSEKKFFRNKVSEHWYILDTYTSGKHTIPAAVVKYRKKGEELWQEIESNEISLEVKSVLQSADNSAEIHEIKGPKNIPLNKGWYAGFLGLLLLFVAAGIFFLIKRKKENPQKTVIPLAHELAYQALAALKNKDYPGAKKIESYYVELSDIIRRYLENRFHLRAPEMTTEEFLNTVKNNKSLSREHARLLREFLSHCDLVKFAKYAPVADEMSLSFESAKKLVDQTKQEPDKL